MQLKEAILIKKCRKRNAAAQKQMVQLYTPYLYNICCRYVRDEAFAKDCLQESWIQIFWNLDKYKEDGKWKSWIARVTINKCKELLRKHGKWKTEELEESLVINQQSEEDIIMEEESVNLFLDQLPQKYRIVVNMYVVEGYSHKEIAAFLEINESSSRSILSRAMKMLKEIFEEPSDKGENEVDKLRLLRKTIFKKAII